MEKAVREERIKTMEGKYDRALKAVSDLDEALANLKFVIPEVEDLIAYYESDLWRKDFRDNSAGKVSPALKCGVLSEDGIYNLITDYQRLAEFLSF